MRRGGGRRRGRSLIYWYRVGQMVQARGCWEGGRKIVIFSPSCFCCYCNLLSYFEVKTECDVTAWSSQQSSGLSRQFSFPLTSQREFGIFRNFHRQLDKYICWWLIDQNKSHPRCPNQLTSPQTVCRRLMCLATSHISDFLIKIFLCLYF